MNSEESASDEILDDWQLESLIIRSQDYCGYRRESAVKKLCNFNRIGSIKAIIIRTNDWVPQVRMAAKDSFLNMLQPENTKLIIEVLPEIYHLKNCRRVKSAPIIKALESYLGTSEYIEELKAGIESGKEVVALMCARLLIKHKLLGIESIIRLTQRSKHNIVRLKGAELFKQVEQGYLVRLLNTVIKDRYMPVRRKAAQLLLGGISQNAADLAEKLLLDKHHDIRSLAIAFLKKRQYSLDKFYIKELANNNVAKLRCAIWAIGELKLSEQTNVIISYLESKHPSIRKQALLTLYQLEYEQLKDVLIKTIVDSSLTVRKTSAGILESVAYMFIAEDLMSIISSKINDEAFATIIRSCRKISKWDRVGLLLSLAKKEEFWKKNFLKHLVKELDKWSMDFNKSGIQPTEVKIIEIRDTFLETRLFLFKNGLNNLSNLLLHVFKTYHIKID
ncbi:MAG: HEAT repeat domain-containing protein [Kangiellaceae bacterium]|nr:HEAT repeat domain-containing protein [Kangiellaceae bacterium]